MNDIFLHVPSVLLISVFRNRVPAESEGTGGDNRFRTFSMAKYWVGIDLLSPRVNKSTEMNKKRKCDEQPKQRIETKAKKRECERQRQTGKISSGALLWFSNCRGTRLCWLQSYIGFLKWFLHFLCSHEDMEWNSSVCVSAPEPCKENVNSSSASYQTDIHSFVHSNICTPGSCTI